MIPNLLSMAPDYLPYPNSLALRALFNSPILLYRLGLGRLVGHKFVILTTSGRKSGRPRHTALEFYEHEGRKYIMAGYGPQSDWYRNILINPNVTLQTDEGLERKTARRLTADEDLLEAYHFLEQSPLLQMEMKLVGFDLSQAQFLSKKDQLYILTFDPTDQITPPPLKVDLWWIWGLALLGGISGYLLGKRFSHEA